MDPPQLSLYQWWVYCFRVLNLTLHNYYYSSTILKYCLYFSLWSDTHSHGDLRHKPFKFYAIEPFLLLVTAVLIYHCYSLVGQHPTHGSSWKGSRGYCQVHPICAVWQRPGNKHHSVQCAHSCGWSYCGEICHSLLSRRRRWAISQLRLSTLIPELQGQASANAYFFFFFFFAAKFLTVLLKTCSACSRNMLYTVNYLPVLTNCLLFL